ncbi:hypothetical protein KP79_PYT20661 [Mizuhopecten yessoensis]|uniref:Uncharacterized protein n=1 Tax=Mizuhopecten yessoensis TaxID=6573 RepID=A0A210QK73_MIZYE|nr:hypothetical protein KP79_PYT20661 [Mizuhopecten yessoensis]
MGCSPSRPNEKTKSRKGHTGERTIAYFSLRGQPDGEEIRGNTDNRDNKVASLYYPSADMPTETTSMGSSCADPHEKSTKEDQNKEAG